MDFVKEYRKISRQADRVCKHLTEAQEQYCRLKDQELEAFRRHDSEAVEVYHQKMIANRRLFGKVESELKKLQAQTQALSYALADRRTGYEKYKITGNKPDPGRFAAED